MAIPLTTLTSADWRRMNVTRPASTIFIGVDLGKQENYSTIVVLERFEVKPDLTDALRGVGFRKKYVVRQAERVMLGTPYTEVVKRVKRVVEQALAISSSCFLVVDESGPGVPVVEMMREVGMGCPLIPITITSGQAANASGTSVPRAELVTKLQLMLERGELEVAAGCRNGAELERELEHLQLSGKAAGESDDLAMALAMVCWKARVR